MLLFIFKSVLVCSLVGTALFALFALLRPLTEKHFSASWHYITGLLIMIIMITPIRAEKPLNYEEVKIKNTVYEEKNDKIETAYNYDYTFTGQENNETKLSLLLPAAERGLSYIWLFFACAIFVCKHIKYRLFRLELLRSTDKIVNTDVPIETRFRIRKGDIISSPMIMGVIFPTLYLPEKDFTREELKLVLSHETVHLQRRDLIAKRLILFVRCVHFFNPAVHLLAKRIELDCEISCDLAATEKMSGEEQKRYMLTLLKLVPQLKKQYPLTAGIVSGKATLKRRFTKIISREKISKKTKLASAILAVILIAASLCVSGVLASGIEKPETVFSSNKSENESSVETICTTVIAQTEAQANNQAETFTGEYIPTTAITADKTASFVSDGTDKFYYPCGEKEVSCRFGDIDRVNHNGVDFSVQLYSPVYAATESDVVFSGEDTDGTGNIIIKLRASDGTLLIYEHLNSVLVKNGEKVRPGDIIAKSGATGFVTGPCLHFSVVKNGEYVDPMNYLG